MKYLTLLKFGSWSFSPVFLFALAVSSLALGKGVVLPEGDRHYLYQVSGDTEKTIDKRICDKGYPLTPKFCARVHASVPLKYFTEEYPKEISSGNKAELEIIGELESQLKLIAEKEKAQPGVSFAQQKSELRSGIERYENKIKERKASMAALEAFIKKIEEQLVYVSEPKTRDGGLTEEEEKTAGEFFKIFKAEFDRREEARYAKLRKEAQQEAAARTKKEKCRQDCLVAWDACHTKIKNKYYPRGTIEEIQRSNRERDADYAACKSEFEACVQGCK